LLRGRCHSFVKSVAGQLQLLPHLLEAGATLTAPGSHDLAGGDGGMDVGLEGGMELLPALQQYLLLTVGLLGDRRAALAAQAGAGASAAPVSTPSLTVVNPNGNYVPFD
jgi:hypothetical protein